MAIERTVQNFTMLPTSRGFLQFFDPQPPTAEQHSLTRRLTIRRRLMKYLTKRAMFPSLYSQDIEWAERRLAPFGSYEWAVDIMRKAS